MATDGGRRLLDALLRPLAADAARARFWRRHLQVGVTLSVVAAAWFAVNIALEPPRTGRSVALALAVASCVLTPVLLLVPVERWSRDRRGAAFFYAWSVALVVVITMASVVQGSMLIMVLLLALALTYAALAYPPLGVLAVGLVMAVAQAVASTWVTTTDRDRPLMVGGVFLIFTVMTAWSSRNQWQARAEQETLAATLERLAATDPLTGCLNRRAFVDLVRDGLADEDPVEVVILDLDGFKQVNDRWGHAAGDELLREVAAAVSGAAGPSGRTARLGGDEFAVLAAATATRPAGSDQLGPLLEQAVRAAVGAQGVGASVGSSWSEPDDDTGRLLARADTAMYRAKRGAPTAHRR